MRHLVLHVGFRDLVEVALGLIVGLWLGRRKAERRRARREGR